MNQTLTNISNFSRDLFFTGDWYFIVAKIAIFIFVLYLLLDQFFNFKKLFYKFKVFKNGNSLDSLGEKTAYKTFDEAIDDINVVECEIDKSISLKNREFEINNLCNKVYQKLMLINNRRDELKSEYIKRDKILRDSFQLLNDKYLKILAKHEEIVRQLEKEG